jgi:predicted Holliday junction resolvase-like endonuclease
LEVLLAIVIVVLVAVFVTAPLRRKVASDDHDPAEAELAELEARKQAKYRQIRDAENDRAAGKLTDEDFRRLDRELRGEAISILKRMDRLRERSHGPPDRGSGDL